MIERPHLCHFGKDTMPDEGIVDPAPTELEARWDQEWEFNLTEAGLDRLKRRVNAKHYQIFDLCLQGMNSGKVAEIFIVPRAYVYLIRYRLIKLFQIEMANLLKELNK